MSDDREKILDVIEDVGIERREAVRRLLKYGAFANPVVASFAMQGLSISSAMAANMTS